MRQLSYERFFVAGHDRGGHCEYFDAMGDDPNDAPKIILEGLNLTNTVVVPHIDNPDFKEGAKKANQQLNQAGFKTLLLSDNQVCVINGDEQKVI